jgi:hypothetical protein
MFCCPLYRPSLFKQSISRHILYANRATFYSTHRRKYYPGILIIWYTIVSVKDVEVCELVNSIPSVSLGKNTVDFNTGSGQECSSSYSGYSAHLLYHLLLSFRSIFIVQDTIFLSNNIVILSNILLYSCPIFC